MNAEQFLLEAQKILRVGAASAAAYVEARDVLLDEVNAFMTAHPQLSALIGGNPLGMMYDNHRNHIDFLSTVFKFHSFDMLAKTLPWVYHSYRAHGFSFDYFPVALEAWKSAVNKHLPPAAAAEILTVYDWMIQHHHTLIDLSALTSAASEAYPELTDERRTFGAFLLAGNYAGSMKIAESVLARENGQEALYLGLIKPVMYEIGSLWEDDKISTAEEHLATSLVGRILAALYDKLPFSATTRGKAIVTSAPNEYHELGARLLADMLESDGWDVLFLGANTPAQALIDLIRKNRPRFVAISLTIPFSIDRVSGIISAIRNIPELSSVKIMVGGAAFSTAHDLWRQIGADAWADTAPSAIRQVRAW
ncbi:MAG: cobalamin-dependent protein [Smithellaceae bacterium]